MTATARPYSVQRANAPRFSLDWQGRVNALLIIAGYESGERAMMRREDFDRLESAYAAGESAEAFAASVLRGASS